MSIESQKADRVWREIQEAIELIRLQDRRLADHLADHIIREGDSFRYTGKLKWKVDFGGTE